MASNIIQRSQADLTGYASPITSSYTSQSLPIAGCAIWKLKIVVSAVSGSSPVLTPSLVTFDKDGNSMGQVHPNYNGITSAGTYWFVFDNIDPSNSPVADVSFQLKLTVTGTTPSFTITSIQLFGISYTALLSS